MSASDCCPESVIDEMPCALVVDDDCAVVISYEEGPEGPPGPQGPPGAPGADSTVAVGTTTTGAPGTLASVVNSGTPSAAVLDFTIPRGDVGPAGPPGAGGALGYYGVFYDSTDQTTTIGTPTPMLLGTTAEANGVSIVAGSQVTFANAGTYDLQFSAQMHHRGGGGGGETVDIWFALNGTPLPDSATRLTVPNGRYLVPAWDYMLTVGAGDFLEIVWQTDNAQIALEHTAAGGGIPAVPSVIATVMQVMYTQVGPAGPPGPTGPAGIAVQAVAPLDTTILWADTSAAGDAVLPAGGGTGDVLAKLSASDYDAGWATRPALAADPAFTSAYAPKTPSVGTGLGTSGTVTLDLAALDGTYQSIALTGGITFATSNRAAGRTVTVKLSAGGSSRALAWPSWIFVGSAAPTTLAANKSAVFTVTMFDATDAGAIAAYAAQP